MSEKNYAYSSAWKDELTEFDGDTITYDEVGNPLSYRDGMTFTWQNGRQLASLQTAENSITYKYDSNGMRTQKTDNSGTTYYYYDSDKNLIGLTKGDATLLFYYDSDGNVTSFKYNGTMYYYIKNLQGDVVKIINQSGTEVAGYVYDAWGNIRSTTGDEAISSLNPFRYRGYVYDEESELYYLQSRYYDPFVGRFLNADDTAYIGATGTVLSTNMFAYCENNPISMVDSHGNFGTPIQWAMAVIGGVAGWFFGDYVAKKLGCKSGWKYWAIRAGVTVGGAVIGWFAGTLILKIATKFLLAKPAVAAKLPKFVLWFLGLGGTSGQIVNQLFERYAGHIFSKKHIADGIMKLGSSQRDIFNKVFKVISSKITHAQNGDNQINAIIKGFHVTIRFHFKDGTITSIDAFMTWVKSTGRHLIK